ncbi:unnamed protein product [Gordionus sp. m RMFG-2023]|uniref:pre-mRNA-splicing factor CWC25 homolog n=1 Tax=Gordionus sp. m RMFG-2023 TaxID=3053472 RepID=UPI0030DF253C
MDWMYNNSKTILDREAYLLGKSIDKNFQELQNEELKGENTIRVDKFKIKEDPLNLIEIRKYQYKKDLLRNPIKLKKFKQMLMDNDKEYSYNIDNESKLISEIDLKILKKWKKLKKSCFYFQNIALQEFASPFLKNTTITLPTQININHPMKDVEIDNNEDEPKHSKQMEVKNRNVNSSKKYFNKNRYNPPTQSPLIRTAYRQNKDREREREKGVDQKELLRQMRLNAEWNKKRRKDILDKEEKRSRIEDKVIRDDSSSKAENFVRPMLSEMAKMNTLESRIRNNRSKIHKNMTER